MLLASWRQFLRKQTDSARWQRWTCLGLAPATILVASMSADGFLINLLLLSLAALAADGVAAWLRGTSPSFALADCSALALALMFGLLLPVQYPWWLGVSGVVFGLLVAKQAFGGQGEYLFQPLAAAYVFIRLAFPDFSGPSAIDSAAGAEFAGVAGTRLIIIALLAGALPLLLMRAIDWRIPVVILVVGLASIAESSGDSAALVVAPVRFTLTTSLLLVILFIAPDPVTSPVTAMGRCLFALIIVVAMAASGWPADLKVLLAIVLLANFFTALIDLICRPRIFGHRKRAPVFENELSS